MLCQRVSPLAAAEGAGEAGLPESGAGRVSPWRKLPEEDWIWPPTTLFL